MRTAITDEQGEEALLVRTLPPSSDSFYLPNRGAAKVNLWLRPANLKIRRLPRKLMHIPAEQRPRKHEVRMPAGLCSSKRGIAQALQKVDLVQRHLIMHARQWSGHSIGHDDSLKRLAQRGAYGCHRTSNIVRNAEARGLGVPSIWGIRIKKHQSTICLKLVL